MSVVNSLIFIEIDKRCRICLNAYESMHSIYDNLEESVILEETVQKIADALTRITFVPIEPEDGFPTSVCSKCLSLINAAYKFKIQFEQSYEILQKYIAECKDKKTYLITTKVEDENENQNEIKSEFLQETVIIKNNNSKRKQSSKVKKKVLRKPRQEIKLEFIEVLNDSSDIEGENKIVRLPCPVCYSEFPPLALKKHIKTHKTLRKYLSIPNSEKVQPNTKFYANPNTKPANTSIFYRKDKKHKCVFCNEEHTTSNLREHLQIHRNQKEFRCEKCDRVFKRINHLNTHKVKHLKEYPYKCIYCGKGFVIKTNYDCHMLTHNFGEELPLECKYCLKRFANPEHLNRHILIHTENISYGTKYKCLKCNNCLITFRNKKEYEEHNCSSVEAVMFCCKICKKVFKTGVSLYAHHKNMHSKKKEYILCSVCGKYVINITSHMMRHEGIKNFACNLCDKKFVAKTQLNRHLFVHTGSKPHICSVCSKAFNSIYNLQVHERIHVGDRCHVCHICTKGFLEKSYLNKHLKKVHLK